MNFKKLVKTKLGTKGYTIIFIIILVIIFSPLFIAALYNRPAADDFIQPALAYKAYTDHGIFAIFPASFSQMISCYNSWNGVFFSMFLSACPISIINEKLAIVYPFFFMATLLWGIYRLVSVFSKIVKFSKKIVIVATGLIFFIMIGRIPSLSEGIFWFSGAINYTFMFSLALILVSLILEYSFLLLKINKVKRSLYFVFICILSLLLGGGNFTTSVSLVVIYFYLFLFLLWRKNNFRYLILLPYVLLIAGLIISVKAPGNAIRQSYLMKPTFRDSIIHCLKDTYSFIYHQINLQFIILSLLFLPISILIVRVILTKTQFRFPYPFGITICSALLLISGFMPPEYSIGITGPDRLINIQYFMFVLLYFINMLYYIGWVFNLFSVTFIQRISKKAICSVTSVILLLIAFTTPWWYSPNLSFVQTSNELKNHVLQTHAAQFDAMISKIKVSTTEPVTVANFDGTSAVVPINTLVNGDWVLNGISNYYGKKVIVNK